MSRRGDWTRQEIENEILPRMRARTVPVGVSFEGRSRILDLSEVRELLSRAGRIVQSDCTCRARVGACGAPAEGCLALDGHGEAALRRGGREISVEAALEALERAFDAGLVHLAFVFTDEQEPGQVCSCCSCCCHSLGAAVRFGYAGHVLFSRLISEQDDSRCSACGACVDRCHFRARTMEEGIFTFDESRCAGCGLCVPSCPVDAITMVARDG